MGSSQVVSGIRGDSASPARTVLAAVSSQAAANARGPLSDAFDARLTALLISTVRSACGRRSRQETTSLRIVWAINSQAFRLALAHDEAHGLSMEDAAQVLVAFGGYCPRHRCPMLGDDVAGFVCHQCEVPAHLKRIDCDPCEGSCTGRCDAGAGTYPERQAAEARA